MPSALQVGDNAPLFTTTAVGGRFGEGQKVSLADFRGHTVILYFYPKDDTPGCTTQACSLRDAWPAFPPNVEIFGVSIDSAKSHLKFINKHQLPFPLLTDEEKAIVTAYEVWVEKNMYGFKKMGTERSTFVIDPAGRIQAILRKVKPAEHVAKLREIVGADA